MRLHIENVAKIKEADIDFNGITVIAGKNNTGKSTVGKVLYCVVEGFHDLNKRIISEKVNAILSLCVENYGLVAQDTETIKSCVISMENEKIIDCIKNDSFKLLYNRGNVNWDEIQEYVNDIVGLKDKEVMTTMINNLLNGEFNHQCTSLFINDSADFNITLNDDDKTIHLTKIGSYIIDQFFEIKQDIIYLDDPNWLDQLCDTTISGNSAIHKMYLFHELNSKETNVVEQTLRQKRIEPIMRIMNAIIDGKFVKNDKLELFSIPNLTEPLKIQNLSMGIKVVVLLKKLLESGRITNNTILIMDEPEIHLHPEWQLKLAEILVMLQKEMNVKLLINTHSPYFINAIEVYSAKNNLADHCKYYLSYLDKERAYFKDVTVNVDEIYKLLAEPLNVLNDLTYEN